MKAEDYRGKFINDDIRNELARQLRRMPEEDRFPFILELIDVNEGLAKGIVDRVLRDKSYFLELIPIALESPNPLGLQDWILVLVSRLGLRKVVSEFEKRIEQYPERISYSLFYLRLLSHGNEKSLQSVERLKERLRLFHH